MSTWQRRRPTETRPTFATAAIRRKSGNGNQSDPHQRRRRPRPHLRRRRRLPHRPVPLPPGRLFITTTTTTHFKHYE